MVTGRNLDAVAQPVMVITGVKRDLTSGNITKESFYSVGMVISNGKIDWTIILTKMPDITQTDKKAGFYV